MTKGHRPHSSIYLTVEQIAALRDLAGSVGYRQTRGAGAGTLGSMSAMMTALADAYADSPAEVTAVMLQLLRPDADSDA